MNDSTSSNSEPSPNQDSQGRRTAKNTVTLVVLRVLVPLFSVALMVVLSRILGVDGVGRYTLAYGYLVLLNTVGALGLFPVITREGARDPSILENLLGNAFTLGTVSSVFLTLIMVGLAWTLGYDPETQTTLVILSLAILPSTLARFLEGACVAIERTQYIALSTIAEHVLKVGAGIALLYLGYGLNAVLFMAVAGRVVACVVYVQLLRIKHLNVRWSWDLSTQKRLLELAPTFILITVFATLHWRVDVIMLSKLGQVGEVGYYGAAWRLFEFGLVIPTSLCLALYPAMAALVHKDMDKLARLGKVALRYLFAITLPIACATMFLGEDALVLVFGESFRGASLTLTVLVWTLLPYSTVRYHAYMLVAVDRQKVDLVFNVVVTIVNIALNWALIPRYGHLGAAYATLGSFCIYALIQYIYMKRVMPGHVVVLIVPPVVVYGTIALAVAMWGALQVSFWLAAVLGSVVYAGVLVLGGFFSKSELALLGIDKMLARLRMLGG